MVLNEGSRVATTGMKYPIVLGLWSSYKVHSFASRQLGPLPSFAVYIPRRFELPQQCSERSRGRESHSSIDRPRNRSVRALQTAVAASFLVLFSKIKYLRLDKEKTFPTIVLFVEIHWEIKTQWLSKLIRRRRPMFDWPVDKKIKSRKLPVCRFCKQARQV